MPYSCKVAGTKWQLTKKDGGEVFGNHDTKKQCMSQMRAMYTNEIRKEGNIVLTDFIQVPWNLQDLIDKADKEINLVIDSRGGSPIDAIMIHNRLRNSGKFVNTYIQSFAMSAAAITALAGDKIYIAENGVLQFHPVQISSYEAKNAKELENIAEALKVADQVITNTLMSRTKMSKEECEKIIQNDTWMTADQALKLGIVDEVIPIFRDNYSEVKNMVGGAMSPPETIINFVKDKNDMSMKEVCQKFGIENETEEGLVAYIQALQPAKPTNVSDSMLNMISKSRETMLNSLVTLGKAIPAVTEGLKKEYLEKDRIKKDLQNGNTEFDAIVDSHMKNAAVINFGGGDSGPQQLAPGTAPLQKPATGKIKVKDGNGNDKEIDESNVLIENMQNRIKNFNLNSGTGM